MTDFLQDVGSYAGLAAFIGLGVLSLLYFMQARDVRRLRENAEFLVEGEPSGLGEPGEVPTSVTTEPEPERAARAAAASAPNDAEAFRRAELARQAAERRQRFESRRRPGSGALGERFGSIPSGAVIAVGAVILIAGVAFGASQFLGDDESAGGGGGDKKGGDLACPPGSTKVAVLNGTAEPGLASELARPLKDKQYDVIKITNTTTPIETSTLMVDRGGEECVPEIGPLVDVQGSEPMDQETREIAEGAVVAFVVGEDKASGGTDIAPDDSTATEDSSAETLGD
jgi:hypothetical protein